MYFLTCTRHSRRNEKKIFKKFIKIKTGFLLEIFKFQIAIASSLGHLKEWTFACAIFESNEFECN
jgi:hypothetical protein